MMRWLSLSSHGSGVSLLDLQTFPLPLPVLLLPFTFHTLALIQWSRYESFRSLPELNKLRKLQKHILPFIIWRFVKLLFAVHF